MKNLFLIFIVFIAIENSVNAQWMAKENGTDENLCRVYFLDENNGWTIGLDGWYTGSGLIIQKTTNAGEDWVDISPTTPMLAVYYKSIWFTDQLTGYIGCYLGSGGMCSTQPYSLKTFDGGTTWQYKTSVLLQSTYLPGINDVFFIDDMTGWMVRGYQVYITSDGISGSFGNAISLSEYLNSIHFINQNVGWVAGENGLIAKTSDGGLSWDELSTEITHDLKSVYFVNSSDGWAVGYSDETGIIIKSTDGGQSWHTTNFPSTKTLRKIYFMNENIGWACGSIAAIPDDKGVILITDDGGDTWEIQHTENNCSELYDMDFIDYNTGWAVGRDGVLLKIALGGYTDIRNENNKVIKDYALYQNHPNPFNLTTVIKYQVPKQTNVKIHIYDINGSLLKVLVDEVKNVGNYSVVWNGKDKNENTVSSGTYFYQIQTGDLVITKKMILLK